MKNLFTFSILMVTSSFAFLFGQKYELEDAILTNCSVGNTIAGFSGTGYVADFDRNASLTLTVYAPETGQYDIYVCYESTADESKVISVTINEENLFTQGYAPSPGKFVEGDNMRITMKKGENRLVFATGRNVFNLDYIRIVKYEKILNPDKTLVNPNATKETKELFDYFLSVYGKNIISGQTDTTFCNYVASITDRRPKVCAFDFMDYTSNKELNMDGPIRWAQDGGIVTFQWHWRDPMTKNGNFYAYPQYDNGTAFDASKIFEPESDEYKAMIEDIDYVSSQLKILQDNNIPVLWRPLHEATGNDWDMVWFWWSNGSGDNAAACKELWRVMYDRMVNHHGLNNLLWTWNTGGSAREEKWYPGDEQVDLIGADVYGGIPNSAWGSLFDAILLRHGNKMIAMTECGSTPDPEKIKEDGAYWLYFCVWGNYIKDHKKENSIHALTTAYNNPFTISLPRPDYVEYPYVPEGFLPSLPDAFEAEDAEMKGSLTVQDIHDGHRDNGYVGTFTTEEDELIFTVNCKTTGEYDLHICYLIEQGWGDKGTFITINEGEQEEFTLEDKVDNKFHETTAIKISLQEGINKIKINKNWGFYWIDYIRIPGLTTGTKEINVNKNQVWMQQHVLHFYLPELKNITSVSLYTVSGTLLREIPTAELSINGRLNCQELPAGIYMAVLNTVNGPETFKVIKQ